VKILARQRTFAFPMRLRYATSTRDARESAKPCGNSI